MNIEDYKIEVIIILVALFCTISSLIVSYLFPWVQILVLTILTLLLSAIYQMGYVFVKEYTRGKNECDYSRLQFVMQNLREENDGLKKKLENYGEEFEEDYFDKVDFSSSESGKKLL